jgi:hypothetical protein
MAVKKITHLVQRGYVVRALCCIVPSILSSASSSSYYFGFISIFILAHFFLVIYLTGKLAETEVFSMYHMVYGDGDVCHSQTVFRVM